MCFDSHFVICVLCAVVSSGWGGNAPGARSYAVSLMGGWLGRGFWVGCMVYRFFFLVWALSSPLSVGFIPVIVLFRRP